MNSETNEFYAAIDMGSNSFHMVVAAYSDRQLQVIDRIKESVRFAAGLNENRKLDDDSVERALKCLERFGQRIREIPRVNIRAVGTNTLRQARNRKSFLRLARQALGHPIEIISGREEARLTFLGVAHTVYSETDQRLVIDIGGGSTEFIIGKCFEPFYMESLYMGCVNVSQKYFKDGNVTNKQMRKAMLFAQQELESIQAAYNKKGWDAVLGSSGTILAVDSIVREKGWSESGITSSALKKLRTNLIETGSFEDFDFEGLSDNRKAIFAGGVAILSAAFEALEIKTMSVSDGAVREGLLYDLIGRTHQQDIREATVIDLANRYKVDMEQARRIETATLNLFKQAKKTWSLDSNQEALLLRWAATVHELGLSIAHAQYHKHGAYLIAYSDMPGFSSEEQLHLSMLVRAHRRKFPLAEFETIPEEDREQIVRLSLLFRLAVVLNRSRSYSTLPLPKLKIKDDKITLGFPAKWLAENPLTQADLEIEADYIAKTNYRLIYN
ncbi:MAG: exopolyphosphatase [Gammaproteobacteria bacterium]|nr:exopolyphosphatase [Gammaproteobacteria bacterium]